MKTLIASLLAVAALAGAANASTQVPVQSDNSVVGWCGYDYRGH